MVGERDTKTNPLSDNNLDKILTREIRFEIQWKPRYCVCVKMHEMTRWKTINIQWKLGIANESKPIR